MNTYSNFLKSHSQIFTAFLIVEILLASCTSAPISSHALEWQWPRSDPSVAQEYGVLNTYVGKYHTGLDIEGTGEAVFAAAQGTIVNYSPNKAGACPDYNASVDNHNMQGFVILQHTMPDGSKKYSLYVHLNQINENLKIGQEITRGTPLVQNGGNPSVV
ncbi:MAG: M23 family metallopeptidase [candidate division Zixibacteria bacterium]|nr:M23 family metallopeptidase [candidate division Zixibacteria bacterium]